MHWVEAELNDPKLFPSSKLDPWPKSFNQRLKRIFTRLHRVFVHVYFSHFRRVQEIAGEAQVCSTPLPYISPSNRNSPLLSKTSLKNPLCNSIQFFRLSTVVVVGTRYIKNMNDIYTDLKYCLQGQLLLQALLVFCEAAQPCRPNRARAAKRLGGANLPQEEGLSATDEADSHEQTRQLCLTDKNQKQIEPFLTHSRFIFIHLLHSYCK